MKARAIFAGLAVALTLTGCSSMSSISNPFEQPSITETYISQFRDVPIPAPMSTVPSETLVTVGPDGSKFGLESFTGRVDGTSLANVMMQNMARQGWQLRGSSVGVRSVQLYEKSPHYAAIFYREGVVKTSMDVWVVNGVNVDILSLVPEVHNSVDSRMSSSTYSGSTYSGSSYSGSSYGGSGSGQVTKLSE
ncbi:hypothetical protein [Mailhella sp.]|uniref:hypothetical protein n=1 Tax=Mailhella sp. TaxID=1981029 RepID=UPI003AB7ABD0